MRMATLLCSRCEEEKAGLDSAPMGGPNGQLVLENVCVDCWAAWRETSSQLINHHQLVLGNPEHRWQLRMAMKEFLGLDDDDDEEDGSAAG